MRALALLALTALLSAAPARAEPPDAREWFAAYHNYTDVVVWFKELAAAYNKNIVFYPRITRAAEGRDVICARVSSSTDNPYKPKIFVQSLQSGREWATTTTTMYLVYHLVSSRDPDVLDLLDRAEFVFVPMANPDGYDFTWTADRAWVKNRALTNGTTADARDEPVGVALNRNWDDHWIVDNERDEASDAFGGRRPWSEKETSAMAYFIAYDLINVAGLIDLRAYGQEILYPSQWTTEPVEEAALYREIGGEMARLIERRNGTRYSVRQASERGETFGGTALDWGAGDDLSTLIGFCPLSLQVNIRPTADVVRGYELPAEQISDAAQEFVPAFLYFSRVALDRLQRLQQHRGA
eukprot:Unigene3436_Nuclearia_a/m.10529 Unigene3436_Nuclearia_a/g.10529  ORF Unigene3436_Nuclearia_a/g.10529 Unigene3436_Nuclearia_a/m.10529 type:complete len:354 (+) Unigene3436_Nuclearia_a:48-1109(+)